MRFTICKRGLGSDRWQRWLCSVLPGKNKTVDGSERCQRESVEASYSIAEFCWDTCIFRLLSLEFKLLFDFLGM